MTGWNPIIQLRRMLGLFSFFYATLHFLTWFVLDWFFDFRQMAEDIAMRPFITLGMATFLMLLALARDLDAEVDPPSRAEMDACCIGSSTSPQSRRCCISGSRARPSCRSSRWCSSRRCSLLGFRVWWAMRARPHARAAAPMKAVKM